MSKFTQEIKRISVKDSAPVIENSEEQATAEINTKKVEKSSAPADTIVLETAAPAVAPQVDLKAVLSEALEEIKASAARQAEEAKTQLEAQFKAQLDAQKAELEAIKQERDKAVTNQNNLADLFRLTGSQVPVTQASTPALHTVTTTDSDVPVGILKEALSIVESTLTDKRTGMGTIYQAYDYREFDRYVRQNQAQVLKDLEVWGKRNGLMRGNSLGVPGMAVKEAATQASDIVGGFLITLSSIMRQNHQTGKVFWQFPTTEINFGKGMGTTIDIPRAAFLPTSSTASDWQLSGSGAFVEIATSDQPIQTGVVQAVLAEWGMGKSVSDGNGGYTVPMPAVKIPTFVAAHSMIDLKMILQRNIGNNYAEFEDLQIRNLFKATSRVVYNAAGSVTTTATGVGSGGDGTMSVNFLISLYSYMSQLKILPYDDGCFVIVLNPIALAQLKKAIADRWRATTPEDLVNLSMILNPQTVMPEDTGKISGYVGTYYGFHVFETNAFGIGSAGTELVQNVTLGTGSKLTRSSLAFGMGATGRGQGDPMEIRVSELTNYQRKNDYVWVSTESFIALDVDPTGYSDSSTVPQQLRVIEVRTTDVAQ